MAWVVSASLTVSMLLVVVDERLLIAWLELVVAELFSALRILPASSTDWPWLTVVAVVAVVAEEREGEETSAWTRTGSP